MRMAGLVYVAYFALSIAGVALKNLPLQVGSTAGYFVLAVFLYRLFAPADLRVALALLPLAAFGCVIQGVGQVAADAGLLRLALLPFALFLVVLGYLIARSTIAPLALGILVAFAGITWCFVVIPGLPSGWRCSHSRTAGATRPRLLPPRTARRWCPSTSCRRGSADPEDRRAASRRPRLPQGLRGVRRRDQAHRRVSLGTTPSPAE